MALESGRGMYTEPLLDTYLCNIKSEKNHNSDLETSLSNVKPMRDVTLKFNQHPSTEAAPGSGIQIDGFLRN